MRFFVRLSLPELPEAGFDSLPLGLAGTVRYRVLYKSVVEC
jgi:hypothetical protein